MKSKQDERIPAFSKLLWPTLEILRQHEGWAKIPDILKSLARHWSTSRMHSLQGFERQPLDQLANQASKARTWLKKANFVENSIRGEWSLTRKGRQCTKEELERELAMTDKNHSSDAHEERYAIPLILTPQPEGGYTVTCPTLPELITEGDDIDDVMTNVRDALQAVLEIYEDTGQPLPAKLKHLRGADPIKIEYPFAIAQHL